MSFPNPATNQTCEIFIIYAHDVCSTEEFEETRCFLREVLHLFPSYSYHTSAIEIGFFCGCTVLPIESDYIQQQFAAILGRFAAVNIESGPILNE